MYDDYETDDWYALSWHARDWTILEWDIEQRDALESDPRFGEIISEFLADDRDAFDDDLGGYIAVIEGLGNRTAYPGLLGDDASAFVCELADIAYVQIAGPFPTAYNAQYHIDGRLD